MKYTDREIQFLINNWNTLPKSEIEKNVQHSWSSISDKANKLGLKRSIDIRSEKLKPLIDIENPLNHYWWGFILADGHISAKGELTIQLADKDQSHLEKISKIVNKNIFKVKNNMSKVTCMDKYNANILCKILGINPEKPKTYNPPTITEYMKNPAIAMSILIGIIDGDGCVSYRKTLKGRSFQHINLQIHKTWEVFLSDLLLIINNNYNLSTSQRVFTRKYDNRESEIYQLYIYSKASYDELINHINKNNLPVMNRKWQNEKSY